MKKHTLYFLNPLSTNSGNYILHYFFDTDNFSGNRYIYNNTPYTNYTGEYIGNNLISNLNISGQLYFDGNSYLKSNLQNFSTNRFSYILDYEKDNNESCVLFSCLNTGSDGKYYGFNLGVGAYNNLLIEYYDTGNELRYLSPTFNLDTKGIIVVKGFDNYIYLNYFNVATEEFFTENFSTNRNLGNNINKELVLGSGKYSNLNNYQGYFKNFVVLNTVLENNQLKELFKQFIYQTKSNYSFTRLSQNYVYRNYPANTTTTFDSYVNLTGFFNEFGDDFLEKTGIISGSITGTNYSLDLTGISGKGLPNPENLESLKNNIQKLQIFGAYGIANDSTKAVVALLKNGTITGWGDNIYGRISGSTGSFNDWTGTPVGRLNNIIDIDCKNYGCLALLNNGTVTGWGLNNNGDIFGTTGFNNNNGNFTGIFINSPLGQLSNISNISKGRNHSLFLKNDGTLLSWGKNDFGQVGGINDRVLGYPLYLIITGVYSSWPFLLNKRLDFTGYVHEKPAYKYLNDLENFNLTLKYNSGNKNWVFNYGDFNSSILLKETGNYPTNQNATNGIPYQVQVFDSFLTEANGIYHLDTGSSEPKYYHKDYGLQIGLDNFNQPLFNLFNIKKDTGIFSYNWSIFNGGENVAYVGTGNDINFLPQNRWSGISNQITNIGVSNGFFDEARVEKMNIDFNLAFNSDLNGIFTGNWIDTNISKLTGVTKISAGFDQNFALLNNQKITGWGKNVNKNVDTNNSSEIWSGNWNNNILSSLTGVIDIQSVSDHTLVLFNNRTISGWGSNHYNDLFPATGGNNLTGVIKIGGGDLFSQALLNNNILTGWGLSNSYPFFSIINDTRNFNCGENGTAIEYITGQDIVNSATGNSYFIFNKIVEKPFVVQETVTVIYQRISGFENRIIFSGITGFDTVYLTQIPDVNNSGFDVYLVTGRAGVIYGDVLTGVQILSYNEQIERIIDANSQYQTSFSRPILDIQRTGNYIYEFNFRNRPPSNIDITENLYLDPNNYKSVSKQKFNKNTALTSIKNSIFRYSKNISLDKDIDNLTGYGVDELIINQKIDNEDIIEIYNFDLNENYNITVHEGFILSRTSNNFRFVRTGTNYILTSNGLAQFTGEDYTISSDLTLASPISNYQTSDILQGDFIKNNQYFINYTGQFSESSNTRDFIYLNGVKLISGYHYNFNNNNINFINSNIPATGLIYAFDSLFAYNTYTGNVNYYDLPRFNKRSILIWLNGIKVNSDSYYEISQNDSYDLSDFSEKSKDIIYNNTRDFLNI